MNNAQGAVRTYLAALFSLFVLLTAGFAAAAPTFPALTGRVVDDAGLLQPQTKAALDSKLAQIEAESSDQLVVVTLPSLQGYEIEEYGYQLGRAWGIGQAKLNNGVLLIIAPNERKVRIEVGYGLEGVLTDALSHEIISEKILPQFKAGNMEQGIIDGVTGIDEILKLSPEERADRAAKAGVAAQSTQYKAGPADVFGIIIFIIILILIWTVFKVSPLDLLLIILSSSGRGGGGFGGGGGGGFSGGGGSFGGGGSSGSW